MEAKDFLFEVMNAIARVDGEKIKEAVKVLREARERGSFVWLIGNGGSAATASHFANDLEKVCGIRAVSLPDLAPMMTAYGNDEGWHKMFARMVEGYVSPQDVLVVFSCSGFSGNVIEAVKVFHGSMIVFTGDDRLSKLANAVAHTDCVTLFVDHADIMAQESAHLAMCHAIAHELRGA